MRSNPVYQEPGSEGAVNWIIVDLDGTLSDFSHRKQFLRQPSGENHSSDSSDWDNFNNAAIDDPVKKDIRYIVSLAATGGTRVAIITGRNTKYAQTTMEWLHMHSIPCDLLLMRDFGDWRSDIDVKRELFEKFLKHPTIRVRFCLEDRDKVTELWRSLGFTCLQVMKGEY